MSIAGAITIIKLNLQNQETWRYNGQVIKRTDHTVVLEARFNRPDLPFHGIVFGQGDRFVEIFYDDRWYNIFEIHDRSDNHLKGWYCNVSYPAKMSNDTVSFVDLALDLLVYPDGCQKILDEDEFTALNLPPENQTHARIALKELQALFEQAGPGQPPDPAHWANQETL